MISATKPEKCFTKADWETYYDDPKKFAELFADYNLLKAQQAERNLSTSQQWQLEVIEQLIEKKLA